ncbi:hypothetical protein UFOVP891_7 [uncultured Caudovirales phage]|uniref:Uncharacterized protein n=1 Tax=uncultured Caudovirales phage TaxID=2100421 RepID=A0A6J5PIC7_9CAUD|nr:hypothetical protein UFOVP472_61 [uncultured Caudovirales phage]CAB4168928.1 hypothetical protein UFOVP891_7 [uncultured Caudovirales phage]CAB4180801.1 hypothetical protein UFOVP1053_61 [uncultured Caudovirales phage]CAB4195444.1 hypothetical protein UFOVP1297_13 [uncultured Caudovirales phage]CAB4221917.1 hypothetical protein UFOVP1647_53 [uncultured Caudovirales phage]
MTTIYEQARECLSDKHKHMIYSAHEYKKIIAGLLAAIDSGNSEPVTPPAEATE